MSRRRSFVCLSTAFLLLASSAVTQSDPLHLKRGDTLPPLSGSSLTGKRLDLPPVTGGAPAAVICSFSRAAGRDAQNWSQHIAKDDPHVTIYTVIFLEAVPRLFRSMAVSGIRHGMPPTLQSRTILIYRDEDLWKQRLQITDTNHVCVILLGPNGHIQWTSSTGFTDAQYSGLRKCIRTSY
ncbi:MAG TPA: hypothetical protein VME86_08170 [Acidobacteriaceae bacterium]|nr:hypothetical protein [Acidobacteriaceae bacterium]